MTTFGIGPIGVENSDSATKVLATYKKKVVIILFICVLFRDAGSSLGDITSSVVIISK
jgi:hypothetical protein